MCVQMLPSVLSYAHNRVRAWDRHSRGCPSRPGQVISAQMQTTLTHTEDFNQPLGRKTLFNVHAKGCDSAAALFAARDMKAPLSSGVRGHIGCRRSSFATYGVGPWLRTSTQRD